MTESSQDLASELDVALAKLRWWHALVALALLMAASFQLFRPEGDYQGVAAILRPDLPPDQDIGQSAEELGAKLEALHDIGRQAYLRALTWDLAYLVSQGMFLSILLLLLSRQWPAIWNRRWRWLAMIPLLAAVADLAENLILSQALTAHPANALLPLLTVLVRIKLVLAFVALAVVFVLAVATALHRLLERRSGAGRSGDLGISAG